MDKLPCSTSFLMSVNFDGLKEVIDFFHKNINILNEKINDLNKKFRGFEEIRTQLYDNKIKTESSLRLLNELDDRINNISQNIIKNTEKTNLNEQKINKLDEDIVKLQININNNNNNNNSNFQKESDNNDVINKLYENYKELKEEIQIENNNNKENIDKLNQKINELEQKIDTLETNTDINNNINNFNNVNINDNLKNNNLNDNTNINDNLKNNNINNINSENNNERLKSNNINNENNAYNSGNKIEVRTEPDNNKNYELLSKRIDILEQNVNKLYLKSDSKNNNEIYPSNTGRTTVIKEISVNKERNNNSEVNSDLEEMLNKKLDEFSEKITKIEEDIRDMQFNINNNKYNKNININMPQLEELSKENILDNNEKKDNINENINNENNEIKDEKEKEDNKEYKNINKKKEEQKEEKEKYKYLNKHIAEIIAQIDEINNKLLSNDTLKKIEFNKYAQKIDIQLKDYNDKINKILQKDNLRNKLLEDMSKNMKTVKSKQKIDDINNEPKTTNNNNNYITMDMLESIESRNRELIIKYISNIDLSTNSSILEINKKFGELKNLIKELSSKNDEILITNKKNNDYNYSIIDNIKRDTKINMKKIENEIERITSLQEEIDFFRVFLLGKEEEIKYKNMSQEDKKNELLIGTSIKEEMTIHGNYLKKLSDGINKVNNRINNLNKETLILIKKDLKSESNSILEDFKSGLKDSINRIETQLKEKVDKLGLDEFWNKINDQLVSEIREKIDKKEMNKNNQYIKRKIDNLESKISRTLVDTLIDLQMDEAPLMVKRNFREITEKKCASCGQNLPNINNVIMSNSSDFNNFSQYKIFKPRNISDKDKLPEIKQTLPK